MDVAWVAKIPSGTKLIEKKSLIEFACSYVASEQNGERGVRSGFYTLLTGEIYFYDKRMMKEGGTESIQFQPRSFIMSTEQW